MGNWAINIQGVGPHHNGQVAVDADLLAAAFVQSLQLMGQRIDGATFTCGSAVNLLETTSNVSISINGRAFVVHPCQTYESLKTLAGYKDYSNPTMTMCKHAIVPDGNLEPGLSITLTNGVRISVADTSHA